MDRDEPRPHDREAGPVLIRGRLVHLGVVGLLAAASVTAADVARNVGATGTTTASSYVPITPCRLMDTRPGTDNVGTRTTPIGPGDTYDAVVWGLNGNCNIPASATAVTMNVTAIAPTAASFLTVYPTDTTRPLAASLNWTAGQAPTPNAVTTTLSTTGHVGFYNLAGTVNLTADIVGYYQPTGTDSAGPQGPPGPSGPIGTPGPVGAVGPDGPNAPFRLTAAQVAADAWAEDPGRAATITVQTNPYQAYFDGSSIWVTNTSSGSVSRVDRTTNAVTNIVTGAGVQGVTGGGGSIWVANTNADTVSRIDPGTNAILATIALPAGSHPAGLAHDAGMVWVVATGAATLFRIDDATDVVTPGPTIGTGGLVGVVAFGSLWVSMFNGSTVQRIDLHTGSVAVPAVPVGAAPGGMVSDGAHLWVSVFTAGKVVEIDPATDTVVHTITLGGAAGVTYDGTHLWATSSTGGQLARILPATATITATVPMPNPVLPTFDGTDLWVPLSTVGKLAKLLPF